MKTKTMNRNRKAERDFVITDLQEDFDTIGYDQFEIISEESYIECLMEEEE